MQAGDRCVIHTPGGGGWGILGGEGSFSSAVQKEATNGVVHIPRAARSLAAFEETQGGQH